MNELTFEQVKEKLESATTEVGNAETLVDYMKAAVDRFDLAAAHDTYIRMDFPDHTVWGSDGYRLLEFVWRSYNEDRLERLAKHPDFTRQVGHLTIEDFRSEVYP